MASVTDSDLEVLRSWFVTNGGELHPVLRLYSDKSGLHAPGSHLAAAASGPAGEDLLKVPLHLTLSILNIPDVAPHWPKPFLSRFANATQVLSRLLIVEAYLQGESGFWWPYLQAVPQPPRQDAEDIDVTSATPFETPLYWAEEEQEWLRGTALHVNIQETNKTWTDELSAAISHLEENPPPSEQLEAWKRAQPACWKGYTWELYKWAATILSSRSFDNSTLRGWRPSGMKDEAKAEEQLGLDLAQALMTGEFSVIYPVLDIANHHFEPFLSLYNPGEHCILGSILPFEAGSELCINYNANSNEKFLWAYGFMLDGNPYNRLRLVSNTNHIQGTKDNDQLLDEGLRLQEDFKDVGQVREILKVAIIPSSLLPLAKQLANEREEKPLFDELDSSASPNEVIEVLAKPEYRRDLYQTIDKVVMGLQSYRSRLEREVPKANLDSKRFIMASELFQGNMSILNSNITLLKEFLKCEDAPVKTIGIGDILGESMIPVLRDPLRDLIENATTFKPDAAEMWKNGLHEMIFTIWICLFWVHYSGEPASNAKLAGWLEPIELAYGDPRTLSLEKGEADNGMESEEAREEMAIASSYLQVVQEAARASAHRRLFALPIWTERFLRWGLVVYRKESLVLDSQDRVVSGLTGEEPEELLYWGTLLE